MAESVAKRGAVLLVGSVHHIANSVELKEISSSLTSLDTVGCWDNVYLKEGAG